MKKITLLLLTVISLNAFSQEKSEKYPQDSNKRNELKIDAFSLIAFSSLDINYEYLLNKDTSLGIDVFYNFGDPNSDSDLYFARKFSLTPYYRWFFSEERFARGFFVEGFGMLNTFEDDIYYSYSSIRTEKETSFALGVSVGGKFVTKSGFTAEVSLGVGRNLFNTNNINIDNSLVTRGGISIGYRF
jgi:hypothetical protein